MLRALVITDPIIIVWTMVMWSASMLASFIDGTGRAQHREGSQIREAQGVVMPKYQPPSPPPAIMTL